MSKHSCIRTKKSLFSTAVLVLFLMLIWLPIRSYADGCNISKCSNVVLDSTVTTYSTYYLSYIPASLQDIYAADGGNIRIYHESDPLPEIDTSGWSNIGNIIGYFEWSSGPLIMLSTKPVERASACVTDQAKISICHEFGHYITIKSNILRGISTDYRISDDFEQAFKAEKSNYNKSSCKLPKGYKKNISRTAASVEFYATIFAGLMLYPEDTMATFPRCSALVLDDMNYIINNASVQ